MISVIIPLYNKARYIERTIQSVLQQSHQDFEIIVVDDESSDGGDKIVEQMAVDHPAIQLIRRPNGGQSAARNSGIKAVQGDLIAFLDADDQWRNGYLESLAEMRHRFPEAGVLATGYRVVYSENFYVDVSIATNDGENCQVLLDDYFRRAASYSFVWVSAMAIPGHLFKELGLFLEGEHIGGDTEMIGRIALNYPVAYDRRLLAIYRADAQGRQNPRRDRQLQEPPFVRTYAHAAQEGDLSQDARDYGRDYIQRLWLNYINLVISVRNRSELKRVLEQEINNAGPYSHRLKFYQWGSRFLPMDFLYFANRFLNSRSSLERQSKMFSSCGLAVKSKVANQDPRHEPYPI